MIEQATVPGQDGSGAALRFDGPGAMARRLLAISAGLLLLLASTSGCQGEGAESDAALSAAGPIKGGMDAPDFTLDSLGGERVSLNDYQGRPVLINFWASWCPPCREEFPVLAAAREAHAASGFEILGVTHNDGERYSREFVEESRAGWPMLADSDDSVWRAYGAIGLPSSYFIDADGTVQRVHFGPLDHDQLEDHLSAIGIVERTP